MKKIIFFIIIIISFNCGGCNKTGKYTAILDQARVEQEKVNELRKKEKEAAKKSFGLYQKVEQLNRTLLGKNELILLGQLYKRFENDSRKQRLLSNEAQHVERKFL